MRFSQSIASAMYDCQAKADFRYFGRLAGATLTPRKVTSPLYLGTIWGQALVAYHNEMNPGSPPDANRVIEQGFTRVRESLSDQGILLPEDSIRLDEEQEQMHEVLVEYIDRQKRVPVETPELEVVVPLDDGGEYVARFDGIVEVEGKPHILEVKLRMSRLYPIEQVYAMRQLRWYAWAYREQFGVEPAGIVYDERLFAIPKPPTVLKSGKISRDKSQNTTGEMYRQACIGVGQEIDDDLVAHFDAKPWQQRVIVPLSSSDIDEAGEEVWSGLTLALMMQGGTLHPVRNPGRRCSTCEFAPICGDLDPDLIDALYTLKGVTL